MAVWHDLRRVGAFPCGSRRGEPRSAAVAHGMRRVAVGVVCVTASLLVLAGCGGDDGGEEAAITPEAFQAGLVAREQFTPETAACISGYLFDDFPAEQLGVLASEDTSGLPPQIWGRYTQVVLACQYHDELGVPGP